MPIPSSRNIQLPLADLLRQPVYRRLAGYEDLNDVEFLSSDPTFRLIGLPKCWEAVVPRSGMRTEVL